VAGILFLWKGHCRVVSSDGGGGNGEGGYAPEIAPQRHSKLNYII